MQKTEIPKDNNIKLISMHDEMSSSYLSYAMSVIVSRALPDIRDGLKPVHRRILYAMYKGGYDWSKQFRKSARIVGDVIGKYHPHGDQSVYDALVRMVQDFSMSLPLVQGQGNFGSIDGDPAAAMRYTETRLSKVSQYLKKGAQIYVEGQLTTRKWKDEQSGQDKYSTEIVIQGYNSSLTMLGGGNSGGSISNDNTQSNNDDMSQISNDMDDEIPF